MNNFDLRKFLSENKLTPNSKIINEEADRYDGKLPKILSLISNLRSDITNRPPKTFVRDGLLFVSAEDGSYFADYYPEMSDDPFIDPRLEKIADRYDTYWEWEDAGSIVLFPLSDLDENMNEMNLYNLGDLPSDVEWQEGGVSDMGTENPLGANPSERESYDVEVFGYSPSADKSYEGLAGGSYGETDFDTIDNIEEIPNKRNPYYPGEKSGMTENQSGISTELIDNFAEELQYIWNMGKSDYPLNLKRMSEALIIYVVHEANSKFKDDMDEGNSDSTSKEMFAVEKPNGQVVKHLNSYQEAVAYIDKIDPEGMRDLNIRKV